MITDRSAGSWGARHARWHQRWHQRFRRSLKWRLVALFIALALASTAVFMLGTQRVVANAFELFGKPLLADYADRLALEIGSPPDVERAAALAQRLPIAIRIDGPVVHWSSRAANHERSGDDGHDRRSAIVRHTADGHSLGFSIDGSVWRQGGHFSGWVPVVGLLLLTALAFVVVRRLLRPLDDIRRGAQLYEGGDFSQTIPIRRRDELGELAHQVNAMAQGLQGMLGGQRELLLAISHELRSPLTRARLNAELLAESPERDALMRDLGAMRELIAGLLEGERLAAGAAALQREPTALNILVRELVSAREDAALFRLELADGLPELLLDRPRMQLLLRNLIDNAVRHGADASAHATEVVVRTASINGQLVLSVRDHGPGVSEAQLARLAEPFYRPDDARGRTTGGVGLGLYLCKRVAASHGARFELRRAEPGLEARVIWSI